MIFENSISSVGVLSLPIVFAGFLDFLLLILLGITTGVIGNVILFYQQPVILWGLRIGLIVALVYDFVMLFREPGDELL